MEVMSEILVVLILSLLLFFLLGVIIVFSIASIPEILDVITDAKEAINKYKRGAHE